MNKRLVTLCTMIALGLMLVGGVSAAGSSTMLMATLTGANELDDQGNRNKGDLDGTGTAMVTLYADRGEIAFELKVSNITLPAAAAHIHRGTADVNGDVVVPFTAPDANGVARGTATADAALIREIAANPAGFYVNVHNKDYPAGAVRGQLAAQGLPSTGASDTRLLLLLGGALVALVAGVGMRRVMRA